MKKLKEFLWFLVPFLAVSVTALIIAAVRISAGNILQPQTSVFISIKNYIHLFLEDKTMLMVLKNTYLPAIVCAAVCVGCFTVICKIISKKKAVSEKFYRITGFFIGAVAAFCVGIFIKACVVGAYPNDYPAYTVVLQSPPKVWQTLNIFDILIPIQSAIIVMFLFWLVETIIDLIKTKKTTLKETE